MQTALRQLGISWEEAGLVVVTALAIYALTLLAARIFGQRQFASLSTHDLVFVFALGSIIGRTVLVRTSLAGAALGLATMFTTHAIIARLYRELPGFHEAVQNSPILVVANGRALPDQLQRARLGHLELRMLLREHGHVALDGLQAVILEPTGRVSTIPDGVDIAPAFLEGVRGADRLRAG